MKIVSIYPGHNATVGVFDGGCCKAILHEEKFTNVKNQNGFPAHAFQKGLEECGVPDVVVFPSRLLFLHWCGNSDRSLSSAIEEASQSGIRSIYDWAEYTTGWKWLFTGARNFMLERIVTPRAREAMLSMMEARYGVRRDSVRFLDHHLCHAWTPVFFYGLNRETLPVLVLTLDGDGDKACSKVFRYDPGSSTMTLIAETPYDASPGLLYLRLTQFLGMKPNEHEYKVMGLAAYVSNEEYYSRCKERLAKLVRVNEDALKFESPFNTNCSVRYYQKWLKLERFDNIAAAIQAVVEDVVVSWIRAAIRKTGLHRVALAGGVFMNVKLNQRILNLPEVERLFVMPSCGDESLVIGAAAVIAQQASVELHPIRTMYLGLTDRPEDIAKALQKAPPSWRVVRKHDIAEDVAQLLAKKELVAWFMGAGEWGARSLCHRAILANAADLATVPEINHAVKMRDFWMPFAPTILEEWAGRYIVNWDKLAEKARESADYMILTYDSTPLARHHLRAAIHQKDFTMRPQIVGENGDSLVRKLLKHYEAITGMGGILNTSFNLHGYPLVGPVDQALDTFARSGLRYMAIADYLVSKNGVDSHF